MWFLGEGEPQRLAFQLTITYSLWMPWKEGERKEWSGRGYALESRERMCDVVLFFIIIAFNFVNCDSACPGQDLHLQRVETKEVVCFIIIVQEPN